LRLLISSLCYLAGAAFCLRSLFLFPRLGKQRVESPARQKTGWAGWMAGEFTEEGRQIRRKINVSLIVGWALLLAGMLLGRGTPTP
jgi:hypothetical protein